MRLFKKSEKQKLLNAIKSRVNKGWPTGAVKLINQRDVSILLDQVEIDQQKELIAKGYFLANKNELAIQYSLESLKILIDKFSASLTAYGLISTPCFSLHLSSLIR